MTQAGRGFHRIKSVPAISGLAARRIAIRVDCGMFHFVSSASIAGIWERYGNDWTTVTEETLVDGA